jgi:hypothetical protein
MHKPFLTHKRYFFRPARREPSQMPRITTVMTIFCFDLARQLIHLGQP